MRGHALSMDMADLLSCQLASLPTTIDGRALLYSVLRQHKNVRLFAILLKPLCACVLCAGKCVVHGGGLEKRRRLAAGVSEMLLLKIQATHAHAHNAVLTVTVKHLTFSYFCFFFAGRAGSKAKDKID